MALRIGGDVASFPRAFVGDRDFGAGNNSAGLVGDKSNN